MNSQYLPPRILQIVGLALLIGSAVFWADTGRQSALLMGAAMSLIGLGAYRGVIGSLKEQLPFGTDEDKDKKAGGS